MLTEKECINCFHIWLLDCISFMTKVSCKQVIMTFFHGSLTAKISYEFLASDLKLALGI